MHKLFTILIVFHINLYAITKSEILTGYQKFENKITPREEAKHHFANSITHTKDIPKVIQDLKRAGINNIKDYYFKLLDLPDFGENITFSNFFSSIEYKYVLKYLKPECLARINKSTFSILVVYMDEKLHHKDFRFTFPLLCKYKKKTKEVHNLSFFESLGSDGAADSKNVFYDLYHCTLRASDTRKIKNFERKLHTHKYSKVLSQLPWKKYIYAGKTYNKSPHSTSSHSSTSSGSKTFTCKYDCISDVGIFYETYRNVGNIRITDTSYSSAQDKAYEIARKRCKNTPDKHGHKMRYGSASCDFGN